MADPSTKFEGVTPNVQLKGNNEDIGDLLVHRNHDGAISCWKFTEEEIEEIKRTGQVYVLVRGQVHPPIGVAAQAVDLLAIGEPEAKA